MDFDFIIVGGGSAGCVLANRLSARSSNRVLLIEAGIDTPPGKVPADILDTFPAAALNPRYKWGLSASLQPRQTGREAASVPYDQGKVIGGSSSINFQAANRGAPDDYDEWVRRGANGWGWSDVLPYFRKLERDKDFSGEYHGNDGPLPVQRMPRKDWSGFSEALARSAEEAGLPFLEDQNGAFTDGHFAAALSNFPDRRVSVADAYLDPLTRARPNLQILTETFVEAIEFEGARANGVRVRTQGETRRFSGREIILSAGALYSPAMLMRAGIGPASRLKALGIAVRTDRPGVGENLREHPGVALLTYLPRASRVPPRTRPLQVSLRYSSGHENCAPGDMYASSFSPAGWHRLGRRLGMIVLWVNKPYSVGRVTLKSPDFRDDPDADFNLCSDPRDMARLLDGVHFVTSLFARKPLREAAGEPLLAAYSKRARAAMAVNRTNAALMTMLGWMLDGPASVRNRLIRDVITEAPALDVMLQDRALLEANLRGSMLAIKHPSCTCRMGDPGDPHAVTDAEGRVMGVEGLRVCDGSIMPSLPRANTNIPIVMMAEKIADHILAG